MNNFYITDENNKVISFIDLDKEAALLWHKRWDKKYLANPFTGCGEIDESIMLASSWFAMFNTRITS